MNCIVCGGGHLKKTDPRSWDCLDCGAELYKVNDGEVAVVGNHFDDEESSESLSSLGCR